jgi:hypothetical protein
MSGKQSTVSIAGKRVARAEFIRAFRQRGMNLIIESAHKYPSSILEVVEGLDQATTMLWMVHAVETVSSNKNIALQINGDEIEVAVPPKLTHEVEIAFRYKWVKQLELA